MVLIIAPEACADITNDATATGSYGATAVASSPSSAQVPVAPAAPALQAAKTGVLTDSDGIPGQSAGDRIDYTVTVLNAGNVSISSVTLADPLLTLTYASGDAGQPSILDVGETWTYTGSYTLTLADIDNNGGGDGDIDNTVTINATAGAVPVTATASASTPITPSATLSVAKTASVTSGVKPGDTITYTYVVTNGGNQTVTAITLNDSHDGSGPSPVPTAEQLTSDLRTPGDSTDATPGDGTWSVLAPGDSVTFTATYTVTQTDLDTRQ
jgi:uncharacterized repeat protein (TIGR01451 family)